MSEKIGHQESPDEYWVKEVRSMIDDFRVPDSYPELQERADLLEQFKRIEGYQVGNLINFYDAEAAEQLAEEVSGAGNRLAIAMHPYHKEENAKQENADKASSVISRMVNNSNPRIPPLLLIEGVSSLQSSDEEIGQLIDGKSRPLYYLPSMDFVGSPLPSGMDVRGLVDMGLRSVDKEDESEGAEETLRFCNEIRRDLVYELAEMGAANLAEKMKSLGVETVIIGGSRLSTTELSQDELEDNGDYYMKSYLDSRKRKGAKKLLAPSECVGMLMTMLSPVFDVKLSNFTRPVNRTELESAEEINKI